MNQKTFPLYVSGKWHQILILKAQFFVCAPLPNHCSQYLLDTHKFMKTLLVYQGIGIVVEVPNKAKMDYDDKDLADF
jgi:hypothetical protein